MWRPAGCWGVLSGCKWLILDHGYITFPSSPAFLILLLFPPSVRLPTDESCQVPPQEKCVCVSLNLSMCVCLSTLMATLAVMCLMEDKQHSLRQVFTAKHFPQHHHAGCNRGNTLSPSISLSVHTHTHTHTQNSDWRFGSSVSKLPLSSLTLSLQSLTHMHAHAHTYTPAVGWWLLQMSFSHRGTPQRKCSSGSPCSKLPAIISPPKYVPPHTLAQMHTPVKCFVREWSTSTAEGTYKERKTESPWLPADPAACLCRFWRERSDGGGRERRGFRVYYTQHSEQWQPREVRRRQEWWRTPKVWVHIVKQWVQHLNCCQFILRLDW